MNDYLDSFTKKIAEWFEMYLLTLIYEPTHFFHSDRFSKDYLQYDR